MRDVNGSSPLHLAVVGNHLTIVSLLLQAGADLSGCDGSGRTPLDLVRSRTRVLTAKYNNNNNSNGFLNTAGSSPPDAFHGPKLLSELNEMMDILSIYHTRSRNAPPLYNPSAEYQAGEMSMDTLNAKFQKLSSADNSRLSSSETNVEEIVDEIGSLFATLKLQQQ
ncbi:hypothetical protein BDR26DRAFT_891422 [Obelidium mucronatum]|nr:hypothetical protein BDR26DRAFT_891422 [Obelidium mucronatum]